MDIRALIKEEVLAQKAYAVETTPCRVKLDANENPLAIPPPLRETICGPAGLRRAEPLSRGGVRRPDRRGSRRRSAWGRIR